jgi:hypothetical protein
MSRAGSHLKNVEDVSNFMHQSYIFFLLEDGEIQAIPRPTYVAAMRGQIALRDYVGRRIRIADLYVLLQDGAPAEIENETYSFLYFDENGHADPRGGNYSLDENHEFYQAAFNSQYSNIDCDPQIQKVRESIGDVFSWLPTDEERERMRRLIFGREFPAA